MRGVSLYAGCKRYFSGRSSSDAYNRAWENHITFDVGGDAQTGAVLACYPDFEDSAAHGRWRRFPAGNCADTVARFLRAAWCVVGSSGAGAWTSPIIRMG